MKFKVFIVSVLFICSLLPELIFAQNKVVVIPLGGDEVSCSGTLVGTRWCDQGDGTVLDMTTGLVWLKNADWGGGRGWRHNTTCISPNYICHEDAHTRTGLLSTGATGAGLSDGSVAGDWRLPTKTELDNLANGTEAVRSDNMRAFTGVQSTYYWSSSTYADNISHAWSVHMNGHVYHHDKGTNCRVWPVRAGN